MKKIKPERLAIFILITISLGFCAFLIGTTKVYSSRIKQDVVLYAKEERVLDEDNYQLAVAVKAVADKQINFDEFYKKIQVTKYGMGSERIQTALAMVPIVENKEYDQVKEPVTYWQVFAFTGLGMILFFTMLVVAGIITDKLDEKYGPHHMRYR